MDPELAVVEVWRRIAVAGGQEPLVWVSMEFADDQTQVMAIEKQPGVPREWRIEEQVLAADATERLRICMEVYELPFLPVSHNMTHRSTIAVAENETKPLRPIHAVFHGGYRLALEPLGPTAPI